ncbi:MAG: cytochrome c oxidase assembly protein, partial [Nitrososphaeraceae archaeon]
MRRNCGAGLLKLSTAMRGELSRRLQPKNISRLAAFVLCFLAGLPSPLWAHTAVQNGASAEWHWRPDVVFALIVFAYTYARGWARLRNQSGRVAKEWQLALYLAGLVSVGAALLSPIDALASSHLSMHMVQ